METEFSRDEILRLIGRLEQAQLTEAERKLLVAIFAVAGRHVSRVYRERPITAENLKEELIKAFFPDNGEDYVMHCPMGVNPPNPTWPKPQGPC